MVPTHSRFERSAERLGLIIRKPMRETCSALDHVDQLRKLYCMTTGRSLFGVNRSAIRCLAAVTR